MLPWLLCGLLAAVILVLLCRLWLIQKDLDDIGRQLGERLSADTNNPIFLSTRNPRVRKLAAELNVQLQELRRQRQRHENGDRELKEAVTNISHDLRTPLTAICGYLELLERKEKSPELKRYLLLISGRTQSMKQLTEELLHYSVAAGGGEALRLEPVDLNGAVEEAVASFYGAFLEGGITPRVSLPEERVVRNLNRAALSRVLENLLQNALKYSGGDLEVALTSDGTLTFSNAAPKLDEVQVGRLFDRFFTVEAASRSTGLGLSIAKALTEQMDGRLTARYEAGRLAITLSFSSKPERSPPDSPGGGVRGAPLLFFEDSATPWLGRHRG